jgi:hypothetical protein
MTGSFAAAAKDLTAMKALGRAHLNANRIEEALQVYTRILIDHPEDVDSYLFLGDCYMADGDGDTALLFYSQALDYAAGHPEVHRRIRMAQLECLQRWNSHTRTHHLPLDQIPANPEAVCELLERLGPRAAPVTEAEVVKAARLLQEIVHSPHPAKRVAERLDEIDALLPALMELNIRQAQSEGRPDLAERLQGLLEDILQQMGSAKEGGPEGAPGASPLLAAMRVLFISPDEGEESLRLKLAAEALAGLGCETTLASTLTAEGLKDFDVAVFHQPHSQGRLMEAMAACAAARKPVILNLEADYEQMPADHPDFSRLGLGALGNARAYATSFLLADRVCVPGEALAASLAGLQERVRVIPDGWSSQNELWDKPKAPHSTINLGWVGEPGQSEDVFGVKRMVIRLMREFPQVRLIIGGDPQVYQMFDSLPETRRLFLPAVSPEDYPYLFGQIDLLMIPLHPTPFNHSLSDRRVMEAGIRGIPWVASPIPAYQSWNAGGLLADTPEDWHTHLRQLVLDEGLRAALGQAGRSLAEGRKLNRLGVSWLEMLNEVRVEVKP